MIIKSPVSKDDIIDLIKTCKNKQIESVNKQDQECEIIFKTYLRHNPSNISYNKFHDVELIPDILYVHTNNNPYVRLTMKLDKVLKDYDLLIDKFIPETCPHIYEYLSDNPINIISYYKTITISFDDSLIAIDNKLYKFQKSIPEYLDNCCILASINSNLYNMPNKNKFYIDMNSLKDLSLNNISFYDTLTKFFSQLTTDNISITFKDLFEDRRLKSYFGINFLKDRLFITRSLPLYHKLIDLQFLHFVDRHIIEE